MGGGREVKIPRIVCLGRENFEPASKKNSAKLRRLGRFPTVQNCLLTNKSAGLEWGGSYIQLCLSRLGFRGEFARFKLLLGMIRVTAEHRQG